MRRTQRSMPSKSRSKSPPRRSFHRNGRPEHIARRLPVPLSHNRQEMPMWSGTVDSIHIAPAAKAPTQAVNEVQAVPGAGLAGDRYFLKQGTFFKPEPDFELTLIEAEAI